MNYELPGALPHLCRWARKSGASFKTERQAAFMVQQVLGTRFKFPPKGTSCFTLLQKLEVEAQERFATTDFSTTPKSKRGKGSRTNSSRPVITSATGFDMGLVIFCDGACEPNPGAGGWGFVVYRDGIDIHSDCGGSSESTNNIMEMTGALMALRWIAKHNSPHGVASRLLCDSQYVVKGCNEWRHGWKLRGWKRKGRNPEIANLDLWKDLDVALTLVPITLEWVKGHAGTVGNERADELADMGRADALSVADEPCLDDARAALEQQLRYVVA